MRIVGGAIAMALVLACGVATAQNKLTGPNAVLQPFFDDLPKAPTVVPPLPSAPVENVEAAAQKVMISIAVIATKLDDKGKFEMGTGFCIYSDQKQSYFLTNHHVVAAAGWDGDKAEVFVKPNTPTTKNKVFVGHVKARHPPFFISEDNPTYDLSVVIIDVGNIPPLTVRTDEMPIGREIGIAGYPSFKLDNAGSIEEMQPSAHFGHINGNAIYQGAFDLVEFDAVADHGNSGGPLFDVTGMVRGVVTLGIQSRTSKAVQNNLAIKGIVLHSFFVFEAKVPYHYHHEFNGQILDGVQYPSDNAGGVPSGDSMANLPPDLRPRSDLLQPLPPNWKSDDVLPPLSPDFKPVSKSPY
jgi:hypothetical protein